MDAAGDLRINDSVMKIAGNFFVQNESWWTNIVVIWKSFSSDSSSCSTKLFQEEKNYAIHHSNWH
jgi:hypothetical protein